jgi:thioredoxin 1
VHTLFRAFLFAFVFLVTTLSHAGPFDAGAFEAAQAAGEPVLVEVHADWCPVCAKQKPVIQELLARPDMKTYQVFTIDFDAQRDLLKRFGVQRQSTLIVYKGKQEVGRSTGETNVQRIAALLEKAL